MKKNSDLEIIKYLLSPQFQQHVKIVMELIDRFSKPAYKIKVDKKTGLYVKYEIVK